MMKLNNNEFERINDLGLAVALVCLGQKLIELDRSQPRADFLFAKNKEFDELVTKYWAGELLIEPKRYNAAMRDIKTRLYAK